MPSRKQGLPILISGTIGTGKSTLGKHLARRMKRHYISASHIHRGMLEKRVRKQGVNPNNPTFWETAAGKKANRLRQKNHAFDQQVDREVLRALRSHPNAVTDARLAPWMYKGKAIRIWIQVSDAEAARRVGERDGMPAAKVFTKIQQRYRSDQKLWKQLYGIAYGSDLAPFDLVINTEGFQKEDTFRVIYDFIRTKLSTHEKGSH
ncbi:MAG: cytidylate kinase family protein [Candidatus Iainarchaeum archaeon]|uniref:Cytidylate kinase family protein n=1 Tax=Candidatus Iainarchaeum sp. TaxID=3101447 RepID=A0A7T9DJ56_9ARCH|nr:MAG: cytidylate kinase family protein [Candidatus Diapherotrites archaeon]